MPLNATPSPNDPHAGQAVLTVGPLPKDAAATILFIHGRGASAESILSLYDELGADGCAGVAPQAAGHTWYPQSFLAPLAANQPYLDSALARIESLVTGLLDQGVPTRRIILLGFSQGACLATEFAARNPRTYGAVLGLTGGLIGPRGTLRPYAGSLAGVRVFLGCGDPDPHVPFARVQETKAVLAGMGAEVELRRYPGRLHTVSEDELEACREAIRQVLAVAG